MTLPTIESLSEFFRYECGQLIWIKKPHRGVAVGAVAGYSDPSGYINVTLRRRTIGAHRVIWALHNGRWPVGDIDHINMVKNDNRIENLRECSRSENKYNVGKQRDNKSGFKGVDWVKKDKKWRVRISVRGEVRALGYFDDPELGGLVYAEAARKWHGEFARVD